MKPKKIVKNVVIQGLIFNIFILMIFGFVFLNYVYPEYLDLEDKKNILVDKNKYYKNILKEGIDYDKFIELNSTLGKKDIDKDAYLKNILNDFDKNLFNKEFKIISNGSFLKNCKINNDNEICKLNLKKYLKNSSTYDIFLKNKLKDVAKKNAELKNNDISKKISRIIPIYIEDSSVDIDGLTDFKFINYIENLLDKFNLTYDNQIGIGNLVLEESFNGKVDKKNINKNLLDSKIYYFPLNLQLSGSKRDIINFLYYIENVGKINFAKGDIFVFSDNGESNEKTNNSSFGEIKNYFYPDKDFYNNLFFDIKKISFSDYLDGSEEPAPEKYLISNDIWGFIKDTQGSDDFKIDLDLKFYVKGKPLYKMNSFILNVEKKHTNLLKVSSLGINFIKRNKNNLNNSFEIKAMRNFKKYNSYLTGLKKNISNLKKNSKNSGGLTKKYKEAKIYFKIFNQINNDFIIDLKVLSSDLFEKNKSLLGIGIKKINKY